MLKNLVTRITRDSIFDGPGCRYVVFVKGCHLRCGWCHNPETLSPEQQIMFYEKFCIQCGSCKKAYPAKPIPKNLQDKIKGSTDESYFRCVEACPTNALEFAAKEYTTEWLIKDMLKYRIIYKDTGGGMTISGGEPLLAKEFSLELFTEAKNNGYHTAIDTTGAFEWKIVQQFLPVVDLWLYDFKHFDDSALLTELSISNLKKLVDYGADVWLRIPLIPGYNDSPKVLNEMARIAGEMKDKLKKVFLLPFHPYGEPKYRALGKKYSYAGMELDDKSIESAKSIFLRHIPDALLQIGKSMIQG